MSRKWWRAAGIRALRTMAQAVAAEIGMSVALDEVSWLHVVSVAVMAAILSLLTSLGGLPEVNGNDGA